MRKPYLKPCPFCGGEASIFRMVHPDGSVTYEADCENMDCEVSACTMMYETKEKAAAVWNNRKGEMNHGSDQTR